MNRIVSFIPGRIRVRDPDLRNPRRMAVLEGTLREVDGVETVECRPAAGSVAVQFDPVGERAAFERSMDRIVDAALAAPGKKGGEERMQGSSCRQGARCRVP